MKITTTIILIVMLIAFSMQSTAMAKWQLKPPGEIAKNLGTKVLDHAKENPDTVKEVAEKMAGEDEGDAAETDEKTGEKESEENENEQT